ncbi:PE-PGRS family protein [Trichophyton equinum CBS 127.97]|uniref:PE-PGRS family protein n=1 Tax=Trichophyton equinum (strain ATCC MYA-4606 / CBS 127.97) TaxID=559882 RepID=F2PSG6_TRIEC|nr:PE-PGRS family protein [Trichophyton equinum CBS 127.97]
MADSMPRDGQTRYLGLVQRGFRLLLLTVMRKTIVRSGAQPALVLSALAVLHSPPRVKDPAMNVALQRDSLFSSCCATRIAFQLVTSTAVAVASHVEMERRAWVDAVAVGERFALEGNAYVRLGRSIVPDRAKFCGMTKTTVVPVVLRAAAGRLAMEADVKDSENCGGCGKACSNGNICDDSRCVCPVGSVNCSGACKNLKSDNLNCGACGKACDNGQTCVDGVCACPSGSTSCSGACKNLQTDIANCGTCGKACAPGQTCQNGQCECPPGSTLCSGTCKNLLNDNNNCGTCGVVCGAGRTCQNGNVLARRYARVGNVYVLKELPSAMGHARIPKLIHLTAVAVGSRAVVAIPARVADVCVRHLVVNVTWAILVHAVAKHAQISILQRPQSVFRSGE